LVKKTGGKQYVVYSIEYQVKKEKEKKKTRIVRKEGFRRKTVSGI